MFGKILFLVLVLGMTAAILLVNRQQRIDTATAIWHTWWRLQEHDQSLAQLQYEIARSTQPARLRLAMPGIDDRWRSIPLIPVESNTTWEQLADQPEWPDSDQGYGG